jgi:(S)-2-hydroxyglutarate dehydrogenase
MLARFWTAGAGELHRSVSRAALVGAGARLVPELATGDVGQSFAGVRAQAVGRDGRLLDDFAFSATERALHVRNAPSPAATASLAIAREVVVRAERMFDL